MTTNHPRTEVNLDTADVGDLRNWAHRLEVENPVASTAFGTTDGEAIWVNLEVVDIHMGVELTFTIDDKPVHAIVVYGGIPTTEDVERFAAAGGF